MSTQLDRDAVAEFIYHEARLADEHRYDEWEALWADDALYWLPVGSGDIDPETQVSYIYDNRARLASRIRQLKTGKRHSQAPQSALSRMIGNMCVAQVEDLIEVDATFQLVEARHDQQILWAGRVTYHLRETGDRYQLVRKKVVLVNGDQVLSNVSFLI